MQDEQRVADGAGERGDLAVVAHSRPPAEPGRCGGLECFVTDPKLPLYSTAICNSRRQEHALIHGHRVSVLDRRQHDDGTWDYVVTPEAKTDMTFICTESELEVAEPRNDFADSRPFALIRRMLSQYLHQDFDMQFDSIEDAIEAAVADADIVELTATLSSLETESDTIVEDVLNDHAVYLWDTWTPREFLAIIKSLAIARQSAIQNADEPCDEPKSRSRRF